MNTLTPSAPPGAAPSLARLAYNRLCFGPRPEDLAAMGSFDLTAFVDQQLAYESIDDAACEAYIASIARTDPQGTTVPPTDATLAEIEQYRAANRAANGWPNGNLQRHLWTVTYARALLSKRQLFEVMVDFWTNHLQTNFQSHLKYWEDHHVIRQHALGNFRDLIGASAKSPSMLHFLSNTYSDGNNPNENYARELMELHTMGSYSRVPGPDYLKKPNYTEEDVHAAAQILSGWTTMNSPNEEFRFNDGRLWPMHHWPEKRLWLGNDNYYHFPYGGIEQGEMLLDILAAHPSTAYFIAFKLCRRFISDFPDVFCPDAVEAGAQAFLSSHGDIRTTLRAILLHPKFAQSWGQKIKRPFEFFISTMRAMGLTAMINFLPDDWSNPLGARFFEGQIEMLGQTLFEFSAPTGLPDVRIAWWNTNQVFGRWTVANALVSRYFGDQTQTNSAPANSALDALIGAPTTATQAVDRLIERFIGRAIDPADRTTLINYLGNNNPNATITSATPTLRPTTGIIAASPYAQWR
ncbi:MAG: DUF1800 domain-containing protein [Anaerolineae bacterium]|jgi:uncharacterized protein (DUF1800 family)|nr:DUF1800 domain-containing protein [Anaerolineae bacterium]